MARRHTQIIPETDCIGDSLDLRINPNFLNLDEAVQSLSAYDNSLRAAITLAGSDLIVPGDLRVNGNITQAPVISYTGTTTVTTVGSDTVIAFTSDGTFTVTNALGLNARILVVGGGGGGGGRYYAGGGGGGQVIEAQTVLPLGTISIVVGTGGLGGVSDYQPGQTGGFSQLGSITAMGGGGGGTYNSERTMTGRPGASSGGNSGYEGILPVGAFFGNRGGIGGTYGGGGGGGAGAVGANGTSSAGGVGGSGIINNITGISLAYGAGGGGGGYASGAGGAGGSSGRGGAGATGTAGTPSNGAINSGSGGGGANNQLAGGAGGSGIVIVRFRL